MVSIYTRVTANGLFVIITLYIVLHSSLSLVAANVLNLNTFLIYVANVIKIPQIPR